MTNSGCGVNAVGIDVRHESVFRMGLRLCCGFAFHALVGFGRELRQIDILEGRYVLVYLIKGHGEYHDVNGSRFELKAGSLFQRFPGVRHSTVFQPDEDHFECFAVLPRQIGEILLEGNAASLKRPVLDMGLDRSVYLRFDEVFRDLKSCPETELPFALSRTHRFAVELLSVQKRDDGFLKRACQVLERDIAGRLDLADAARELGMGYSSFRQLFSKSCGMPPGEYRLRRKIEMAQSLLAAQGAKVRAVAKMAGYPDIYSFSKQFKLYTGLTPSQFMKARRSGLGQG